MEFILANSWMEVLGVVLTNVSAWSAMCTERCSLLFGIRARTATASLLIPRSASAHVRWRDPTAHVEKEQASSLI